MALAFFRRHQKTVLIPMVVVLMITFVLWGAFTRSDQDQGGGLDVVGTIRGKSVTYAEATAFMRRYRALVGTDLGGGRGASEAQRMLRALQSMALLQEAQTNQIGISDTKLRRILQRWARLRRDAQDPKKVGTPLTEQDLRQVIQGYGTSADSLRRAVRERILIDRQLDLIQAGAEVSASDEYLLYARAREKVRVLYREFKLDEFRDDIDQPTDEEIEAYYNEYQGKQENDPDNLYRDPQAQLDLLFAETQVFVKGVEVTDEKLKKLYDETKELFYSAEPDAEGKAKYKPFKEVKEIVERRLRGQEGGKEAEQALANAKEEFDKQLKVLQEAPRDEAEQKENQPPLAARIDLKTIAKTFGLQAIETKLLPRSAFFKADGIPQLGSAYSLSGQVFVEDIDKRKEALSDPVKVGKGRVAFRVLAFEPSRVKELAEARETIVKRLTDIRLRAAAKEKADAFKKTLDRREVDWFTLEDTGLGSPRHPIARLFNETALGEVHAPYEDTNPARPPFLVGMVVERHVPNRQDFDSDPFRTVSARRAAFDRMKQNPAFRQLQRRREYRDLKERWEQSFDPDDLNADRSDAAFQDLLLQRWRRDTRRDAWEHYEFVKRYEIRVSESVSRQP